MKRVYLFVPLLIVLLTAGCEDEPMVTPPVSGGTIAGNVFTAATDHPLDGATVSITPGGFLETTDVHGLWIRDNLAAGSYSITISKTGYYDTMFSVAVSVDSAVVKHVSLFSVPPTDGLLAYYALDGDAVDESGNGLHGTLYQTRATEDRFGRSNAALHFNGSAYVDLGTTAALNLRDGFTLSAWVKDSGGTGTTGIITRWDLVDGVDERTYSLGLWNDNNPFITVSRDGTHEAGVLVDGPTSVQPDRWTFVTATYDLSSMKLFIDGEQVGIISQSGMATSPNTRTGIGAMLGRNGDPYAYGFRGAIDEVRIYTRPLNASEIISIYDAR